MKKTILILVLFLGLLTWSVAFGKTKPYNLNTILPCPNISGAKCDEEVTTVPGFIARIYYFSLGIAGALAVGLIVIGGLEYAYSAANPSKKQEARDRIIQAVAGLALLLGAVFILGTINPRLKELGVFSLPVNAEPMSETELADLKMKQDWEFPGINWFKLLFRESFRRMPHRY